MGKDQLLGGRVRSAVSASLTTKTGTPATQVGAAKTSTTTAAKQTVLVPPQWMTEEQATAWRRGVDAANEAHELAQRQTVLIETIDIMEET